MNRRSAALIVAAVVGTAATGCGIPRDGRPTILPGGVVNPVIAPGDVDAAPGDTRVEADAPVFLVQAEHLVKVTRRLPHPGLSDVLHLLLEGPKQAEFGAGTRTAISPQTTLRSARLEGDTAVVDLSGALVEVGGQEQILAVAQIVLTAAAVPGVGQVRLLLEGQAVDIPRADGTLTADTLRAADYVQLL